MASFLLLVLLFSSAVVPPSSGDGVSAYGLLVESVQKASIDFNARIRALGVLVSELERAAVAANTKVDLLSPIDPVSYHELGCVGQNDGCCTEESPCDVGQGDCDTGHHCKPGLVCGRDNCNPSNATVHNERHLFNSGDDCCEERDFECRGGADCCTSERPCDLGEGDCDFDSHCRGELVCGSANCPLGEEGTTFEEGDDCCMEKPVYEDEENSNY